MNVITFNERAWRHLPASVRNSRPGRAYGSRMHAVVSRRAQREMYLGTVFLRNRPVLELMRRLITATDPVVAPVRIAVLGCSIGVEVYSIVWTLRESTPDIDLTVRAIDISPDAIETGRLGKYGPDALALANWPIFDGLTKAEREAMFEWDDNGAHVKRWLQDGISWEVGDASDPKLAARLGSQDIVAANNFLCHMQSDAAERCLRNVAQLVAPGGHLFVAGVDLDVRTRVALALGWEPIPDLREEIHDGDPLVRADWPWRWWGLEPFDRRRPDWETRYTAVFRIPGNR